ncbi:hypothetical protein [Bartonella rattaustraliani]|uniref:hypothetical protein n=1 Tax=Bartonella rattaustraliani TaxID=481139 RepID=UPI0002F2276E|nr:hypothetical protein [Bartonella rattaustraliani]
MISPGFVMLVSAYAPTISTPLPAVVVWESWSGVYVYDVSSDHTLSYHPFTFCDKAETIRQLKQNEHNFDENLEQSSVRNLKLFDFSLPHRFGIYKNFKVVQTVSTHCFKKKTLQDHSEQAVQFILDFYSSGNFKNDFTGIYVQRVASHAGVKTLAPKEAQESLDLHVNEPKKIIQADPLPLVLPEQADAFTHKASNVDDAFTIEGAPSLEGQ